MTHLSIAKLTSLFETTQNLPCLAEVAFALVKEIDHGEPSSAEIERILGRDPALAAGVLRLAGSPMFGGGERVTSLKSAVICLGVNSIRMLGIAHAMQGMIGSVAKSSTFDPMLQARHSLFVGVFAKLRLADIDAGRANEAFTCGLLHDMPTCLLASTAPDVHAHCAERAARERQSIADVFLQLYGSPISAIGEVVGRRWKFSELLIQALCYDPSLAKDGDPFWSAISKGDELSRQAGFAAERWPVDFTPLAATIFPWAECEQVSSHVARIMHSTADAKQVKAA